MKSWLYASLVGMTLSLAVLWTHFVVPQVDLKPLQPRAIVHLSHISGEEVNRG